MNKIDSFQVIMNTIKLLPLTAKGGEDTEPANFTTAERFSAS